MNELMLFENGLVPVYQTDKGEYVVNGRELWESLKVKSKFADWIKNRFQECEAIENEDFESFSKNLENGGKSKEYIIQLDTAKEMAMLERNEIGKQVRRYFVTIEKKYKKQTAPQGEELLAIAVVEAQRLIAEKNKLIAVKDQIIGELKPKADYTDKILKSKALLTITQISKDYGMSGKRMNEILHSLKIQYKQNEQWLLYSQYQARGYTHSETVHFCRDDGRPDTKMVTKWTQKGRIFLYQKLKKAGILPVIERKTRTA